MCQGGFKKQPIDVLKRWSSRADLNRRPHPYQGCALPTELLEPEYGAGSGNRTRAISLEG